MHQHGPDELQGPIRGTSGWWRGLGEQPESAAGDDVPAPPPVKKPRKPRRDARPIRQDLVDRVRKEIADGTYDTEEKWEAALERLLEQLNSDE